MASKSTLLDEIDKVLMVLSVSRTGINDRKRLLSSNTIIMNGGEGDDKLLDEMEGYESLRESNSVPILALPFFIDIKLLSNRPYLHITSSMLNTEDFSKVFADILCMEEATLIIDSFSLNDVGGSRLHNLLKSFLNSFDNRLRIILRVVDDAESVVHDVSKFVERRFNFPGSVLKSKRPRMSDASGTCNSSSRYLPGSGLDSSVDTYSTESLQLQIKEQDQRLSSLNEQLQTAMTEARSKEVLIENKNLEIIQLENEVESLKTEALAKDKLIGSMKVKSMSLGTSEKIIQTSVTGFSNPDSMLKELQRYVACSKLPPCEILYRKVKNFKMTLRYEISDVTKCVMEVTKGLEFFELSESTFIAVGSNKSQAKSSCARLCIDMLLRKLV